MNMAKVLVSDPIDPSGIDILSQVAEVDVKTKLPPEELVKIKAYVGEERFEDGRFNDAVKLFEQLIREEDFIEFLTLPAYDLVD